MSSKKKQRSDEGWNHYLFFFKRVLRHPLRLGALFPSSRSLAKRIVDSIPFPYEGKKIVEIGAGTGAITRELLDAGIPPESLIVVELDVSLCRWLSERYPGITVIQGDARYLSEWLPDSWRGKVDVVISGIPIRNLPSQIRADILNAVTAILGSAGEFLQFTYGYRSPFASTRGVLARRYPGIIWRNIPPAAIWSYSSDHRSTQTKD